MKTGKGLTVDIKFEGDRFKEEYFDKYEGIYTEISQVTRFDEKYRLEYSIFRQNGHDQRHDN